MTTFWMIFRRFTKILQKLPEGQKNVSELFPKITEDYRRFLKITNGNLFTGRNVIFTCEDIMFTQESSPGISLVFMYNNTGYCSIYHYNLTMNRKILIHKEFKNNFKLDTICVIRIL